LYWIEENGNAFLRLDDAYGEYLLDLQTDELFLIVRVGDRAFAGHLESEDAGVVWGMGNNDPSTTEVRIAGARAMPLEMIVRSPEGSYIGAVFGRTNQLTYCPSCPEKLIEKLDEPVH
jgi:hypothetical protein